MAEQVHNSGPINFPERRVFSFLKAWAWDSGDVWFALSDTRAEITTSMPAAIARRFGEELLKAADAAEAALESAAEAAAP